MRPLWTLLGLALFCTALALSPSCAKRESVPSSTARVLTAAEIRAAMPAAILGDTAYAEVNSAWLPGFYAEFRAALFADGVVQWDERYDCNHFAAYYVARAQTRFYLANFQSSTRAQTLALGQFWYLRANGRAHAIVAALTDRGPLYLDPQTGAELHLTPAERSSAFLKLF